MNTHIDVNDPRLIDFVLGELDSRDAAELAAALQLPENSAALREMEALKEAMQISESALKDEAPAAVTELSESRRQAVLKEAQLHEVSHKSPFARWGTQLLAAAALVLLSVGLAAYFVNDVRPRVDSIIASNKRPGASQEQVASRPSTTALAPEVAVADAPAPAPEPAPVSPTEAVAVEEAATGSAPEPEPQPVAPAAPVEEMEAMPEETAPAPEPETAVEPKPEPIPQPETAVAEAATPVSDAVSEAAAAREVAPGSEPEAKSEAPPAIAEAPAPVAAPAPEIAASEAPPPNAEPERQDSSVSPQTTSSGDGAAETADNELVPIQTDIPEPLFGAAPLDYWSPNLEPEDFEDPPYARPRKESPSKGKAQEGTVPTEPDISGLQALGYGGSGLTGAVPESVDDGRDRGNSSSLGREVAAPSASLRSSENKGGEFDGSLRDVYITQGTRLNVKKPEKQDAPLQAYIVPQPALPYPGGESYAEIEEQSFTRADEEPLSTFSLHPDTAAYTNVKRFLENGQRPPADAVRIEEMINYFQYRYPQPTGRHPFSVNIEVGPCPWSSGRLLAKIGLQGREVPREERPSANLVFLIDTSGSMEGPTRLPLVKESLKALLEMLQPEDRVGIVTYAGESRTALKSTPVSKRDRILEAIEELRAGGSTHGSAGIEDAYDLAEKNRMDGGINRVILATDGDFNVGVTNREGLLSLVEKKRQTGIFLTVLGFGMGNLKDANLETLATKGNGNYAYIDSYSEARRVLVQELSGTLMTIAKDAKIQVEFNPACVRSYRLIGFENRQLAHRDFNDDTKDAGEIGAGHTVTALYEVVPVGAPVEPGVDSLRYQDKQRKPEPEPEDSAELMFVKLRYKQPDSDTSNLIEVPVPASAVSLEAGTEDFRFIAAVAGFGLVLRESEHKGNATFDMVRELAAGALAGDHTREEFLDLVVTAKTLSGS